MFWDVFTMNTYGSGSEEFGGSSVPLEIDVANTPPGTCIHPFHKG